MDFFFTRPGRLHRGDSGHACSMCPVALTLLTAASVAGGYLPMFLAL